MSTLQVHMSAWAGLNNDTHLPPVEFQPRFQYETGETVTVALKYKEDGAPAVYCLPKQTLCRVSKFFRNAFQNPTFTEATDNVLHLEKVQAIDIETFDMFAHWILGGATILDNLVNWRREYRAYTAWMGTNDPPTNEDRTVESLRPASIWNFHCTFDAYCMGDYFQCPSFQNHCLGMMYFLDKRFNESSGYEPSLQWKFETAAYLEPVCHWDAYKVPYENQVLEIWDDVFVAIPKLRKQFLLRVNRGNIGMRIKPLGDYYVPGLE
ncbi:hypothetical protein K491DRAFT_712874 [Lophiostoma macrostomum CBS 122681]|uniref:BTB domain-containing protein n=1 Tax=Lophiostoma macrostomum CBS 122681 TaxID=1314788 RepID=A0A6A6TGJ0_9PLEO|nr:hypothetical protein K491DRAFT_712874 [Lophiostoma macrostomum CBS 122681]